MKILKDHKYVALKLKDPGAVLNALPRPPRPVGACLCHTRITRRRC